MSGNNPTWPRVYLAGPILGATKGEANDWRIAVGEVLAANCLKGISPLRCEPLVGEKYAATYEGAQALFGDGSAIFSKNWHDVKNCDAVLCYMPKLEPGRMPSLGSIVELAWAKALQKTVVLASVEPFVINHPVVMGNVSKHVKTLDEGTEFIVGLLAGYSSGKNI